MSTQMLRTDRKVQRWAAEDWAVGLDHQAILTIGDAFYTKNRVLAAALLGIVEEMEDYLPLTVRQVFYQCVSRNVLPNDAKSYNTVSAILTTLRRQKLISWYAIVDRSRRNTRE